MKVRLHRTLYKEYNNISELIKLFPVHLQTLTIDGPSMRDKYVPNIIYTIEIMHRMEKTIVTGKPPYNYVLGRALSGPFENKYVIVRYDENDW